MRATVTFEVEIPDVEKATAVDAEEWLLHKIHASFPIRVNNPLTKQTLFPKNVVIDIEE